jgi:hypothetical protein
MFKNRAEHRKILMARVELQWEDEAGSSHTAFGTLEDRSPSGAGIRLAEPITVGTRLQVKTRRQEFSGIVRHCNGRRMDYFVGIQLTERSANPAPALPLGALTEIDRGSP